MWGPFLPPSVGGTGVDHCPVCPGGAVFLSPCLPLPPVSISLTSKSAEARPALLEISDVETEVTFVQNVPKEDSVQQKGTHLEEKRR